MNLRTWRPVIIHLGQCSAPENFPNGCHFDCQTLNFKNILQINGENFSKDAILEPLLAQLEEYSFSFSQVCQYSVFYSFLFFTIKNAY